MDHNIGHFVIENANYISIFIIALSASFSHCLGMCGGIVIAYSRIGVQSRAKRFASHFIYGFGRITTYMIIGAISAFLGSGIAVSQSTKGGVFIIIGFIMMLFGIFFLLNPKVLAFFEINIINNRIFKKLFSYFLSKNNLSSFYFLGLLNGAIPCGIVYFFALSASVSGGIFNGAIVMFIFGIATLVPMVLFGLFNSFLSSIKYRNIMNKIFGILILIFGVWTIIKGFRILFS